MMRMKTFILLIVLGLAGCKEDDDLAEKPANGSWESLGLNGAVVNKLQIYQDTIYVATDQGFYKKHLEASPWSSMGLDGKSCKSFLLFDQDEILVSIFEPGNAQETEILKTLDAGKNWNDFTNGFGGDFTEPVLDLAVNPSDSTELFASGYSVVAHSDDSGENWSPVYGNWGGFATGLSVVAVNPNDTRQIWSGGQNGIEQSVLLFSEDGGNQWQDWLNLVEAPSVVKEVAFDPDNQNVIYGGFEGGLIKTSDQGQTWKTLIDSDENRFFFGVEIHPQDPDIIYAAGWLKNFDNTQPLIIFRSTDGGNNWEKFQYTEDVFGGVYSMELMVDDQKEVLYLGLYKGGVFRFEHN